MAEITEEDEDVIEREASQGDKFIGPGKVYSTQLTQLLFCGSSSWAINRISYEMNPIAFGTFTFLLGHGLLGLVKYTTGETAKEKLRPAYRYSALLTRILPLPLINTQMYLEYEQSNWIAYSHMSSIILPSATYIFKRSAINPVIVLLIISNASSLAYISFTNENYWGLALSIVALLNELTTDFIAEKLEFVPPVDLWTTALATFVLLAINALESV